MALVRAVVLLLLVASAISFALFAATGQPKYKRFGLVVLKWTLAATLVFFVALTLDRLFG
jgi:hypothetical protein